MATRSRGLSAGFGWLNRGISAGFRHPKPLFGGAALLMVAVLISMCITMPMQFSVLRSGSPSPATGLGWVMALSMLLGMLVLPLYAGYLQVVDAAEQGATARASDIVRPYREGKALRLIGYGILMAVVYIAVFVLIILATGGSTLHWYMQAMTAQANHQLPPTALPDGFGITFLLFMVLGIFSISLGQVALGNRSVFGAISDGFVGTLKNLLPLLMLGLGLFVVWLGVALCFGIAVAILAFIAKLFSPFLMFVVIVPLYIALILVIFTAMFGVVYHLWRDVCGDDVVTGTAEAFAA
jgi:hypothetical protein